ncbi:antibiotic biosynthesis monooxygenase [Roseiconus nitratireducens]|uniref:Antibiotic biosynthesis monooxygenase n=1 Tax=Roseiconus nitratireducens TaxID=2605748 RepID=A0A5M6D498_9BACT|nr:antibiotic biosynthesis monooxygenase [Roseiconus nitratireducens]KAA5540005.1 antibiotic biosynthesis monooxygenase [Roseiconus nitratireducens]
MSVVHVAVTRKVQPGREAKFEQALREFAREPLREPGTTGVHLIAPVAGTNGCEYGILRSFESEEASRRFYDSEVFHQWQRQSSHLVTGDSVVRRLHGLEAFFRDSKHEPPRWKMAVVTWLGVYPSVLLWSSTLPQYLDGAPQLFVVAFVNVFVVVTLAWAVMPLLTTLFAGWLQASNKK